MKRIFRKTSLSLFLSGSIIASNISPLIAEEGYEEIQIAMQMPAETVPRYFLNSELSAEKMLALANKYSRMPSIPSKPKLEFALVYAAANKGLAEAQFQLANFYIDNEVVEMDEVQAAYWLEKAIAQGHQGAKFIYASLDTINFDIGC